MPHVDGRNPVPLPKHWVRPADLERVVTGSESEMQEFGSPANSDAIALEVAEPPSRREFLKLLGAGAAFAAAGCARKPVEKILPYVHAPEELVPGVPVLYASTCGECPAGCGVLVKTREGRPIKLEGNKAHPVNRGALCPRGQASILNLYDPDRLQGPALFARGKGSSKPIVWGTADQRAMQALGDARGRGKVVLLSGTITSPSTLALIRTFLGSYPGAEHVIYDPVSQDAILRAQELSYGARAIPRYRLDKADLLVTLGADPLGTMISPVEYARDYYARRRPELGPMMRVIAIEPVVSLTGSNADQRLRVRPDHLYPVAMAVANEILVARPRGASAPGGAAASVASFEAATVERRAGLPLGTIARLADELWSARGKSLVMAGAQAAPAAHAVPLQIAVNLLNSILGNDGVTVDGAHPSNQAAGSEEAVLRLVEQMRAGEISALLIHGVNPVYTLPPAVGFVEALKRVPFAVSFADRIDETAAMVDLIAPDAHYLESWNDHEPRAGVRSLAQPAIAPLYDVRQFQDTLIVWGQGAPAGTSGSWHAYLRDRWRNEVYPTANAAAGFDLWWEGVLREGVQLGSAGDQGNNGAGASARSFRGETLPSLPTLKPGPDPEGLQLALYTPVTVYDGRFANNAWLQELPDPMSKCTWDNFVAIAPSRAKALGVAEYEMKADVVTVDVGHAKFDLPVHVAPGLHPDVIGIAIGYGRTAAGRVGNKVGQNAYTLAEATAGRIGMSGIPVRVSRTGRVVPLAVVQAENITHDRPIIYDATYPEFLRDPRSGIEEPTHLPSMWTPYEYKGYKWGMAVDLTTCIGCSACMVACMIENNVPVVGKSVVLRGREMHWIRIDRYYSGSPDQPDFTYQPMLCQHCENAPCETVCPVLATVHSSEGLNIQVYNRCVGTRYCSNNCPYKVRRFNWFEYSNIKANSLRLALNPDVTVRSRGVMEKCTFCIQRIRDGKEHAKAMGTRVQDGEIQTACQQTCPTDSIIFGDLNDPKSRIAQFSKNQRGYHVLGELNTRPRITYQSKIRNREGEGTA
jgi:Fe-S-cluster-containing dehydrogenase component/anaerobic selenocysteine-containing dehydrogenase